MERSFIIIKPDAVDKPHVLTDLNDRLTKRLYNITHAKKVQLNTDEGRAQLREHYAHIVHKPFYPQVEAFMCSKAVLMYVVEGADGMISDIRANILGATDPRVARANDIRLHKPEDEWTLRAKYGNQEGIVMENVAHASDSIENGMKEIRNFFGEIVGDILEEDRQRAEEGLSGSTPHQLSA